MFREFKCKVLSPKEIYPAGYDIYAPCALGGTINERTIRQLRCSIVAGSANNQLLENRFANLLHDKGILYAPLSDNDNVILEKINYIYDLLQDVFKKSKLLNVSPAIIADKIAKQIISSDSHSEAV